MRVVLVAATALCQPEAMFQTSPTRAMAAASQRPQPHSGGCVSRPSTTRLTSAMVTGSPVTSAALNTSTATKSSASAMRMVVSVPALAWKAVPRHLLMRCQPWQARTIADPLVAGSSRAGSLSEPRAQEAGSKFVSGSRSIGQVEILSVRVLHTLAQKLGAGVSFSLQGKPEAAV